MKNLQKKYQYPTLNSIITILILELLFWSCLLLIFQYLQSNVKEFRFEYPYRLWLLLLLVPINVLWVRNRNWKNSAVNKFAKINTLNKIFNGFSNNRSTIKYLLFRISIGLLVIAGANPQYGENERSVETKGIDIMIALDISKSMMAEDIAKDYNRLDVAKLAIGKLFSQLKGDHVGIVVFAGQAYKQLPLTPDYHVAQLFLKSIGTDMISSQGTDIGNAIELCMSSFSEKRETNKAIIIISDGEDHEEMAISAAETASDDGVVICTVGMGSDKGVPIPIIKNGKKIGIKKAEDESTVLTKLNEDNLISIANAGNGTYTRTSGLSLDLRKILDRIGKIEKTTLKKERYSTYDDQFQWFLVPALILLFIDFIILEKRGKIDNQISFFKS